MSIEEIEHFMADIAIGVAEGEVDALEAYAMLKRIEKAAEPLSKAVKEEAIAKALEYGADKEPFKYKGSEFRFQKGRSMYSFKHIDSWSKAEEEKKRIEELAKFAAKNNAEVADQETGEMIPPAHVTYAADSLIVKVL